MFSAAYYFVVVVALIEKWQFRIKLISMYSAFPFAPRLKRLGEDQGRPKAKGSLNPFPFHRAVPQGDRFHDVCSRNVGGILEGHEDSFLKRLSICMSGN